MNLFIKDRPKKRDVSHCKKRVRVEGDVTPRTLAEVGKRMPEGSQYITLKIDIMTTSYEIGRQNMI